MAPTPLTTGFFLVALYMRNMNPLNNALSTFLTVASTATLFVWLGMTTTVVACPTGETRADCAQRAQTAHQNRSW